MLRTHRIVIAAGLFLLLPSLPAVAGSVRYDLPELLGNHVWDGSDVFDLGQIAHVDTPYGFYSVRQARLVVEGFATLGRAHGDGVLRQDVEFELLPVVNAYPSFAQIIYLPTGPTIGAFDIDYVYPNPFVPEVTPLPNPDGYPPVSFQVLFSLGPRLETEIPPLLEPVDPGELDLWVRGVVLDDPIVANVTEAYIILEGPGVVPEPTSIVLAGIGLILVGWRRHRSCRRGPCGIEELTS
jgi:PEP-CTERM motif